MSFSPQATFSSVKSRVLELIKSNKAREVTHATAYKGGGIYLLYVDDFSDERILPFYIGQTVDFQQRHQQHLRQILSLNRLRKDCYEYALACNLYNGNYRACKIFSYMMRHRCTLDQLHMIILDESNDEIARTAQESTYIDELFAPFFGFNQMACISQYRTYTPGPPPEEYIRQLRTDAENLTAFSEYGYCAFNWHLIYSPAWVEKGVLPPPEQWSESQKNVTDLLRRQKASQSESAACNLAISNLEKDAWNLCGKTIRDHFAKYNLKSRSMQHDIISLLLSNSSNSYRTESIKKSLNEYLLQHNAPRCKKLIDSLKSKYGEEFFIIDQKIQDKKDRLSQLGAEYFALCAAIHAPLAPCFDYKSHPLKSRTLSLPPFPTIPKENTCYINIEYTCMKTDTGNGLYPEICKIDYLISKNGLYHTRSTFITNSLADYWEDNDVYYYEKGFSYGPYQVFLVNAPRTHISVSVEYKTGINEYTLSQFPAEDAADVFAEISALIDDQTKIVYTSSGYKSSIKQYAHLATAKKRKIVDRLLRLCK